MGRPREPLRIRDRADPNRLAAPADRTDRPIAGGQRARDREDREEPKGIDR
jgi:hypothetical protein